jgi:hypothetical protein
MGTMRARRYQNAAVARASLARFFILVGTAVAAVLVLGIVLVLLEANRDNAIVDWLVGAGDTLSQPFHGIFTPDGRKAQVAVNWGLAAVVYALVGGFIARLLRR